MTECLSSGRLLLFPVLLVSVQPAQALAQRRGESAEVAKALEVKLSTGVRFGDTQVAAGVYRVTISAEGLTLANSRSMVKAATLPVVRRAAPSHQNGAVIRVVHDGTSFRIVVHQGRSLLTATGSSQDFVLPTQRRVQLAAKRDSTQLAIAREAESSKQLITRAMKRYGRDVQHCADRVHRSRWGTDHPLFYRCVCPATEKWRMPKVSTPMRYHHDLAKGRSGFSFTVTSRGRVSDCRVWAGPKPPADETVAAKPDAKSAEDGARSAESSPKSAVKK